MERRRSFANVPNFDSAPLKVIVGKDDSEKTFYINEQQVTKFSEVIAAAIKRGFKEAEERTVRFPEDDPEIFNIFAGFMYSGVIYCSKPGDKTPDADSEKIRLASLWVLGEKLQAAELKDAAVDALIERMNSIRTFPKTLHQLVYPHSVGPSGMRRLAVDIAIWYWDLAYMKDAVSKEGWAEFFVDLAATLHGLYWGKRKPAPFENGSNCSYHDHGSDKACYKTMFG